MDVKMDVKKVANLARLEITPQEEAIYLAKMQAILNYFKEIETVSTEGMEPLITPSDIRRDARVDLAQEGFSPEEALAGAPERSGHLFRVPPVV